MITADGCIELDENYNITMVLALSEFDWFLFCHMIDFFGLSSNHIQKLPQG